jgi:hypothetical protein
MNTQQFIAILGEQQTLSMDKFDIKILILIYMKGLHRLIDMGLRLCLLSPQKIDQDGFPVPSGRIKPFLKLAPTKEPEIRI